MADYQLSMTGQEVDDALLEVHNREFQDPVRANATTDQIENGNEKTLVTKEYLGKNRNDLYNYTTTSYLDVPDTYTQIAELDLGNPPAGVYNITFSSSFQFKDTKNSVFARFRMNESDTWVEFRQEPKDKTDLRSFTYVFPYEHPDGDPLKIQVQMKKEQDATAIMDVFKMHIIAERRYDLTS